MAVKTRRGRGHDFARVLDWSKYKHELLAKYARVWCYKLGSRFPELAFVDTHAGAGKYDDGKDGSPLIVAKLNGDSGMVDRGTGVTVHAFETNTDTLKLLRSNLASYSSQTPPRAVVYDKSFFNNPARVLDATRNVPTLFLIDPYGTTEVTSDHLNPLLLDTKRAATEVIVRIDPTMLARFAGQARKEIRDGGDCNGGAWGHLLERLNIDLEAIVEEANSETMPQDKYELLEQYLRMYVDRFRFVQVVPVRADYTKAPKYMLVHGTDSEHGAAHLNDAVSKLEDTLYTETHERHELEVGQTSMFGPPQRPPRFSDKQLDAATLCFIAAKKGISVIEVRAKLAIEFGPHFREMHHHASIKRLIAAGAISAGWNGKALEPSTLLQVKPAPSL
jgi:three-Cys-motif partner protein